MRDEFYTDAPYSEYSAACPKCSVFIANELLPAIEID
jgi:hypothetical protein